MVDLKAEEQQNGSSSSTSSSSLSSIHGNGNNSPSSSSSSQVNTNGYELKRCSDCQTSKTPLWRGGPAGPKSLCNACGIKYHKKRRALLGIENKNKKKSKINHTKIINDDVQAVRLPLKIRMKASPSTGVVWSEKNTTTVFNTTTTSSSSSKKLKLASPPPPPAEEEYLRRREKFGEEERQAAILLMSLSCGSVCG